MDTRPWKTWIAALLFLAAGSAWVKADDALPEEETATSRPGPSPLAQRKRDAAARALIWHGSLAQGTAEAGKSNRPIFLRAGGESCRFCRALEVELARPELQAELQRWTLVSIDVEDSPDDARLMAVDAIPALRILTTSGKLVASRAGLQTAAELSAWLQEQFEAASATPLPELTEEGPPDAAAVQTLIRAFKSRDATIREAAVRRLLPYPEQSAPAVVSAFSEGSLSTRLAALELLEEWRAPRDGLDPWRPETLTAVRLKVLTDWGGSADRAGGLPAREGMSEDESRNATELLSRMTTAPADESRAIRERLARYGRLLLPLVYEQLRHPATDAARERLTALRYRLVAPESLALGWSGGLERLAAADAETRFRAAEELMNRATPAEEPLLLELFSDPAPLVRELSLRALNLVGGANAHSALIRLLEDPEPNVRAAVLNQLAEKPSRTIVPRIAEYAAGESDPDLVVHAIRVLREAKGQTAAEALIKLLTHEAWQVRAEAAEGLGKFIDRHATGTDPLKGTIYAAMIELLDDPDGFVLSRAVTVLGHADLVAAVEPLAKAAEAHPDLAGEVVGALAQGSNQRHQSLDHIRRFSSHPNGKLRAAAITSLCQMQDDGIESRLETALADSELDVRLAAANGLFTMLKSRGPHVAVAVSAGEGDITAPESEPPSGFLQGIVRSLFGGGGASRRAAPAREVEIIEGPVPAVKERVTPTEGDDSPVTASPVVAGEGPLEAVAENEPALTSAAAEAVEKQFENALQEIRKGKVFDESWFGLAGRLEMMLGSQFPEERVAAVLPLAALGRDQVAVPELLRLARDERRWAHRTTAALTWLLHADRERLFAELIASPLSADAVSAISSDLAKMPTRRAEDDMWSLLEQPWSDVTIAETVHLSLLQRYFPQHFYRPKEATWHARQRAAAAALPRARSGPHWRRIVALTLLTHLKPEPAVEIARALVADANQDPAERVDAFQILLAIIPAGEGTKEALAQLGDHTTGLSDVALNYLTGGASAVKVLRDGRFHMDLYGEFSEPHAASSGQPIVPEPPAELTAEPLLPVLSSNNRRAAAQAGYLLALLERPEGLPPLIEYWRSQAQDDVVWMRLVYRAIARIDDGSQLPLLKEIYARLNTETNKPHLVEFYWTVRSMSHPDVLPFRKHIRQEVGMESLR